MQGAFIHPIGKKSKNKFISFHFSLDKSAEKEYPCGVLLQAGY